MNFKEYLGKSLTEEDIKKIKEKSIEFAKDMFKDKFDEELVNKLINDVINDSQLPFPKGRGLCGDVQRESEEMKISSDSRVD